MGTQGGNQPQTERREVERPRAPAPGRLRVLEPVLVRPRTQCRKGPLERAPTSSSRAAPSSRQCHAVPTVALHATRTRGSNAVPMTGSPLRLPVMLSNALQERGTRPAERADRTGGLCRRWRVQPTRAALPTIHTSRAAGSSLTSIIVRNTWQTTRRNRLKRTQPPSTRRHRAPTHRARATAPARNARRSRRSSCCSSSWRARQSPAGRTSCGRTPKSRNRPRRQPQPPSQKPPLPRRTLRIHGWKTPSTSRRFAWRTPTSTPGSTSPAPM